MLADDPALDQESHVEPNRVPYIDTDSTIAVKVATTRAHSTEPHNINPGVFKGTWDMGLTSPESSSEKVPTRYICRR